jgi:hypothetical protein
MVNLLKILGPKQRYVIIYLIFLATIVPKRKWHNHLSVQSVEMLTTLSQDVKTNFKHLLNSTSGRKIGE